MIFKELILHNFGVYSGRNCIDLTLNDATRPIILFGALNGSGKTTLLDAIRLCFYGKRAKTSNRGVLAYDEYLARCINRGGTAEEGAAVEILFESSAGGATDEYRLHRSWRLNRKKIGETVEVFHNGQFDRLLTDDWDEQVNAFIPFELVDLFFFDGEKIEELADPTKSAAVLNTAIHSLLGLDLVDRLTTDLIAFEKRKALDTKSKKELEIVAQIEVTLKELESQRQDKVQEIASINVQLAKAHADVAKIEQRFQSEGGQAFEDAKLLEARKTELDQQIESIEAEMREMAAGPLPLTLVESQLGRILEKAREERESKGAMAVVSVLEERDQALIQFLNEAEINSEAINQAEEFLTNDRTRYLRKAAQETHLELSDEDEARLRHLLNDGLTSETRRAEVTLKKHEELGIESQRLERKLAAVPAEEVIQDLLKDREQAKTEVIRYDATLALHNEQLGALDREKERVERELAKALETNSALHLNAQDVQRIKAHSNRARETLKSFRKTVLERDIARIETLVLDSFQQLLRKKSLVHQIRIQPDTFKLDLIGPNGAILPPHRLSAGERQLLAVSLLWGLVRTSGRSLPIVIDTPLGRLDSKHRTNLIERYFPNASHQVLLLSTDEEIDKKYFPKIKRHVGRSYTMQYDDQKAASEVVPGYFWN
jgi:DNA sulfur modification protein DndD